MSRITEINLNRVELKLADTDDPVASALDWNPLNQGGSNFKTHEFTVSPTRISIKPSAGLMIFGAVFGAVGAIAMGFGLLRFLPKEEYIPAIFLTVFGGTFMFAMWLIVTRGRQPFIFDKTLGLYFRGKEPDNGMPADRNSQGRLADIHAIQIISEHIQSSSDSGTSSFPSFEMNLVFRDGYRVNVMDHGNLASLLASASDLGDFLGVPVWQASYQ